MAPGSRIFALGLLLAVAAAAMAGGCASAEERRAMRGPVWVEVTNHNPLDVNIYAVSGSQTVRLGTVTTTGTERFEVPVGLSPARSLRLLVDPIGGRQGYLSDEVVTGPGDIVDLVVESSLTLSSIRVR